MNKSPTTFSPQTVITARSNLIRSDLSESEMVMMNIDKGFYYGLEDVGKTIWDSLAAGPRSVSDLCDVVLDHYPDATPEQVEGDVQVFLAELLEEDLIQVGDAG